VVLGTTTSDANGHYSIAVVIPAGFSAGPATLTACGVSIVINIGGATVATLPRTGSSSSLPMARIAVVLVAAGGLLVLSARKRAARASVDT
jgi:LPXTG-motif cell wall-anchored protein